MKLKIGILWVFYFGFQVDFYPASLSSSPVRRSLDADGSSDPFGGGGGSTSSTASTSSSASASAASSSFLARPRALGRQWSEDVRRRRETFAAPGGNAHAAAALLFHAGAVTVFRPLLSLPRLDGGSLTGGSRPQPVGGHEPARPRIHPTPRLRRCGTGGSRPQCLGVTTPRRGFSNPNQKLWSGGSRPPTGGGSRPQRSRSELMVEFPNEREREREKFDDVCVFLFAEQQGHHWTPCGTPTSSSGGGVGGGGGGGRHSVGGLLLAVPPTASASTSSLRCAAAGIASSVAAISSSSLAAGESPLIFFENYRR